MKLWFKYILGCAIGIAATFLIPETLLQETQLLSFLTELAARMGRYVLIPLLFFGVTVGVCYLRETKTLFKTAVLVIAITLGSTILFTVLGLASVLLVRLPRIPISVDRVSDVATLGIPDLLLRLLPYSGFESLTENAYLLPLLVFAGFTGVACASNRNTSKSAVSLFDSLISVCSIVMGFFIDIFSIGLIAISCSFTLRFMQVLSTGLYNRLLMLLAAHVFVIGMVLYPLIVRLVCKEKNPYRVLYASLAPVLAAFFSGDTNIALSVSTIHAKESLGVRRRCGNVVLPIFSIFARGGAAMTTAMSFIIILRSYSSLGVGFSDVLWIGGASVFCSFFLGNLPTGGTYTALMVLCTLYGRGFEAGYLLLRPVAPIICAFACTIDALTMMFGTYITAKALNLVDRRELRFFI